MNYCRANRIELLSAFSVATFLLIFALFQVLNTLTELILGFQMHQDASLLAPVLEMLYSLLGLALFSPPNGFFSIFSYGWFHDLVSLVIHPYNFVSSGHYLWDNYSEMHPETQKNSESSLVPMTENPAHLEEIKKYHGTVNGRGSPFLANLFRLSKGKKKQG